MPSGTSPLGGISSQLVKREESPLTGTPQPLSQPRERPHEDYMYRALRSEKKISRLGTELAQARNRLETELARARNRLETELARARDVLETELARARNELEQVHNELARARDNIDDLEAASELQDKRLRLGLEYEDWPSTAAQDLKIAQLEGELRSSKQQLEEKENILLEKDILVNDLLQAREEGGSGVAKEHQDLTNSLLKNLHTSLALSEDNTSKQDLMLEILGSVADQLNVAVAQANERTVTNVEDAREAYKEGILPLETVLRAEEQYNSEAELLVSVRDTVASQVIKNESSIAKLREFIANARRKYGRHMTNLGPTTQDVDTASSASHESASADTKQVTNSERGDMQQGKVKAADAYELSRRKFRQPPTPKPRNPSKSPAERELLRLKTRQTLHYLNP